MCGIAGYIDFFSDTDRDVLIRMTDSLRHRGPDTSGYWELKHDDYSIGLGHRRLSIIDLSPLGNQPMVAFDGKLCIVFNGEIYNYKEIRVELEELGHTFKSHSDTEVILHAYKQWRHDAVQKFIGMFAFVIVDRENQIVSLFRDRAGVKPLFYYWNNNVFLFGSELKALILHPKFEKSINLDSVASYFQYGFIPTPHSIYNNAYKLDPAHYLIFDLRKQSFEKVRYWDVYNEYNRGVLKINREDALVETESILLKAFQYRMVADVPVGVFLSGGYDSTCVTALL
ncbi:MAG TPA: asparagine synthase (glutamine-hydrolyzing), partial [Puia sp.]|nr:asparagine synthase (glutamine-hydrolyzing) [Puia sp.]